MKITRRRASWRGTGIAAVMAVLVSVLAACGSTSAGGTSGSADKSEWADTAYPKLDEATLKTVAAKVLNLSLIHI